MDAKVMAWEHAPDSCRSAPSALPPRLETEYAAMQLIRWVAWRLDAAYTGPTADAPFLAEVRDHAQPTGRLWLVVPTEYSVALARQAVRTSTLQEVILSAFDDEQPAYVVEIRVKGSKINGPGLSPVMGEIRTRVVQSTAPYSGRFGVLVQFCAMPTADGVPDLYFDTVRVY